MKRFLESLRLNWSSELKQQFTLCSRIFAYNGSQCREFYEVKCICIIFSYLLQITFFEKYIRSIQVLIKRIWKILPWHYAPGLNLFESITACCLKLLILFLLFLSNLYILWGLQKSVFCFIRIKHSAINIIHWIVSKCCAL